MKPNVLFVSSHLSFPPRSGGAIRTFQLLERFTTEFEIDLIYAGSPPSGGELPNVRSLHQEALVSRHLFVTLATMVFGLPRYVSRWINPRVEHAVKAALQRNHYDIVVLDQTFVAYLIPLIRKYSDAKIILSTQNVEHDIIKRKALLKRSPVNAFYAVESWLLKAFEISVAQHVDGLICVSKPDHDFFQIHCSMTCIAPNGVDLGYYHEVNVPTETIRSRLVFVGNLSYKPNEDAILHFLENIFPRVIQKCPQATLDVVGLSPTKALIDAANVPGVTVHADVPDVRPYLRSASVAVIPLRYGGGTKLKVLEAMASGLPVVTTSSGAEGIEGLVHRENIMIAQGDDELVDYLVDTIASTDMQARLSISGRKLVQDHFGWTSTLDNATKLIRKLL